MLIYWNPKDSAKVEDPENCLSAGSGYIFKTVFLHSKIPALDGIIVSQLQS